MSDNDESRTNQSIDSTISDRRTVLKGFGAAAIGAPLLASRRTSAGAAYDTYDGDYGTVIDVTDKGADDTGNQSVSGLIQSLLDDNGDDTLLKFPQGEYYMDEQVSMSNFNHVGIFGPEATLVPADYHNFTYAGGNPSDMQLFSFGRVDNCSSSDLLFQGFEVDQTADDTGIRVIEAAVNDGLEVYEIDIYGRHDSGTYGPGRFNIRSSSGTGIVDNFRAPDGAAHVSETPNDGNLWRGPTGIVNNKHVGELTIKHCTIKGFPDNGVYADDGDGKRIIYGGLFGTSATAALRIGGIDSVVKYPTIHIDTTRPNFQKPGGIRIEDGTNVLVRDATITLDAAHEGMQGIVVMDACQSATVRNVDISSTSSESIHGIVANPGCGPITVEDTTIDWSPAGGYGVWIKGESSPANVTLDNVTITDGAGVTGAGFREGIRNDREDTTLTDVEVTQTSSSDRHALWNRADHSHVNGGTYEAQKYGVLDESGFTEYDGITAKSQRGNEGVRLLDASHDIQIYNSTLYNGIRDDGCAGLDTGNNTIK